MGQLWLPQQEGERWAIVKRLRELGVLVPGWQQLEVSYLQAILDVQLEKAKAPKPPKPVRTVPREQVVAGLRDYLGFLKAKRENRRRFY